MNKIYSLMLGIAVGFALLLSNTACCNGNSNNELGEFVLNEEQAQYAEYGNRFAFNFLEKVNQNTKGEYMVSPLSLQFLLGMVLNGAQEATADEIASVLGYGKGETEAVNTYFSTMLQHLPTLDSLTQLILANALVVNQQYPLLKPYNKTVSQVYQAEICNMDFSKKEEVLARVNGWCNEQSKGMIPEIMNDVSPELMAVLMNAVYFKSTWVKPFGKENTREEDFCSEDGVCKKVQMMNKTDRVAYWENDTLQMVQLPYGNGSFAMSVLLPKEGKKVADILAGLNETVCEACETCESQSACETCESQSAWQRWNKSAVNKEVILSLPRFESKFHIELNKILSEMGMPSVFTSDANLGAMFRNPACMSLIQQDSAIRVDEEGSEAAAITSGMVKAMAFKPEEEIRFNADHSFLYFITEKTTGTILFAGKY